MTNEDAAIEIKPNEATLLINQFCIDADTVFDFHMHATFTGNVDNIMVSLMFESTIVAKAVVNDTNAEGISSLSLLYRGEVALETKITLTASHGGESSDASSTILMNQL